NMTSDETVAHGGHLSSRKRPDVQVRGDVWSLPRARVRGRAPPGRSSARLHRSFVRPRAALTGNMGFLTMRQPPQVYNSTFVTLGGERAEEVGLASRRCARRLRVGADPARVQGRLAHGVHRRAGRV